MEPIHEKMDPVKLHMCKVCDRGFKTKKFLQDHVNTHTGRKPHMCKFCNKAFTSTRAMFQHVRYLHIKKKPHKCQNCDYATGELSKLKRHMRIHTILTLVLTTSN